MGSQVHKLRELGRILSMTQGSDHYINKSDYVEAMDLIIALGYTEGFCMGNVIKYAARFPKTRDPEDVVKIADYAHIFRGALGE